MNNTVSQIDKASCFGDISLVFEKKHTAGRSRLSCQYICILYTVHKILHTLKLETSFPQGATTKTFQLKYFITFRGCAPQSPFSFFSTSDLPKGKNPYILISWK